MGFALLTEFAPWGVLNYCGKRNNGDYINEGLTCRKHFLCMRPDYLNIEKVFQIQKLLQVTPSLYEILKLISL